MRRKTKSSQAQNLYYTIGRMDESSLLEKEFEVSIGRDVPERIQRGFVKTYKPVMDDASYRIFSNMRDYNRWCKTELPSWLGYDKTK